MRGFWKTSVGLVLLLCITHVWAADLVMIVNKTNTNPIDRVLVISIYTGNTRYWPDDSGPIFAVDQGEHSVIRAEFYTRILGKSVATMKVLWAQNIFSGRALPPKVADPDAEVKRLIAGNRNAIGYIRAVSADDTVRVIEIR